MVAPVRRRRDKATEDDDDDEGEGEGVRLNKCLTELSRRAADEAISDGRVTINGCAAPAGSRVSPGDIVRLDGQMQHWSLSAEAKAQRPERVLEERAFVYVKYWKPVGVTCTSDPKDSSNIIKAGQFDLFPQRLFTVGRLDKDSSGLILLTSDGRVNNAMLSPLNKKDKVGATCVLPLLCTTRVPSIPSIPPIPNVPYHPNNSQPHIYTHYKL